MRDYIRQDLAMKHGIDKEMLAHMDKSAGPLLEETPRLISKLNQYSDAAFMGAIDWIIGNAPGALPYLRDAGIYIPDIYDKKEET